MADMSRVWAEFKRTWVLWLILNFSGGMKTLVNQTEQPFARSLVMCDVPLVEGNYTGSRWCGDRLKVLEEGFHISAKGQAQENFAMLCSLAFVGVCIGAFGRKFTVLVGLGGTLTSVALFVVASSSIETGRLLFSIGQGLQGLYPVEYIFGIVVLDLATQQGGDGEATYAIKFYEAVLGVGLWFGLGYMVQFAELTEYGRLWSAILALNIGMFTLAFFAYPETKPKAEKEEAKTHFVMKVVDEVKSYGDLLQDNRCLRFLFNNITRNFMNGFAPVVLPLQLMAYHGWSQPGCVTYGLGFLLAGICFGGLLEKFIQRFGYHDVYCGCIFWFILGNNAGMMLLAPYSDKLAIGITFLSLPLSGFFPLMEFVDSRFCEPEQMHRFKSVQWVMGYFQGIFMLPIYSWFFKADATTYFSRMGPNVCGIVCCLLNVVSVFAGIYHIETPTGPEGFGMTLRQMDAIRDKDQKLWAMLSAAAAKRAAEAQEKAKDKKEEPSDGAAPEAPPAPEPVVSEEVWKDSGLRAAFGDKELAECGGPMWVVDQWSGLIRALNWSPKAGKELVENLDKAMASVSAWAGEEVSQPAPSKDEKKKN